MITLEDCIGLCGLSEEEVLAIQTGGCPSSPAAAILLKMLQAAAAAFVLMEF
jgi:hypothetical protein